MRMFSIPYNGSDPKQYIECMLPYLNNIDSVFFGLHSLGWNHVSTELNDFERTCADENCYLFLSQSKGMVKRLLTLNSGMYPCNSTDMYAWCDQMLIPIIRLSEIDGGIFTDYNMAKYIHQKLPEFEIHTSCNCFQWSVRQMELWRKDCGVSVFNPPREILRTPGKLKEMHDAGFKIKAIVNEDCLFGCPQTINHCMAHACSLRIDVQCYRGDINNMLRGNWVLPRWLKELDDFVDIYKIAGRTATTEYIFNTLDAYLHGRETDDLDSILIGRSQVWRKKNIKVSSVMVPDKLLTCECKECDTTCFLCRDVLNKLLVNEK